MFNIFRNAAMLKATTESFIEQKIPDTSSCLLYLAIDVVQRVVTIYISGYCVNMKGKNAATIPSK